MRNIKISLFFSFILCMTFVNKSFALDQLAKTSLLHYLDMDSQVIILQRILNIDPETQVATSGAGSPGNEVWFFGTKTSEAVKRFQAKYNLEATGQVNVATLNMLNQVALGIAIISNKLPTENTAPQVESNSDNNYLNGVSNEYINNEDTEQVNSDAQGLDDSSDQTATRTNSKTSYLDYILNKYSSSLSSITSPLTNQASSSAFTLPTFNPLQNSPFGMNSPYASGLNMYSGQFPRDTAFGGLGSLFSNLGSGGLSNAVQSIFRDSSSNQQGGPAIPGTVTTSGQTSGMTGEIGQCRATSFAHATLAEGCVADKNDQQNSQKSASGVILSRIGVPAIPAVALPKAGSFYDAVEVKDLKTGKCKAFPLLDRGPGAGPLAKGVCIDLTGSAVDILKGRTPCKTVGGMGEGKEGVDRVQFALIKGDKIKAGETKDCTQLTKGS